MNIRVETSRHSLTDRQTHKQSVRQTDRQTPCARPPPQKRITKPFVFSLNSETDGNFTSLRGSAGFISLGCVFSDRQTDRQTDRIKPHRSEGRTKRLTSLVCTQSWYSRGAHADGAGVHERMGAPADCNTRQCRATLFGPRRAQGRPCCGTSACTCMHP